MSFKRVVLEFDAPICGCPPNFSWGLPKNSEGNTYLVVECETCHIKVTVPHAKLIAGWDFGSKVVEESKEEQYVIIDGLKVRRWMK